MADAGPGDTAVTEDALLGGRVRLRQPARGYRAAIDPVLLAAAVPGARASTPASGGAARATEKEGAGETPALRRGPPRILDLGCGVGAAALCLLVRLPGTTVTGVEREPALAALARANAALNAMVERFTVVEGDIALPPAGAPFDLVMMNPPFLPPSRSRASDDPLRAAANVEGELGLAGWIAAAAAALAPRGVLTLIHRTDRIDEVCTALRPGFGTVAIYPLWPRAGEPARRMLVRAVKGGRGPAALLPGLVLHGPGGRYTPEAEAVLRDAAALAF